MSQYEFSYSTAGFTDRDLDQALKAVVQAGFVQTEVQSNKHINSLPQGKALSEFRAKFEHYGVKPRTIHAPSRQIALGVPDESWRQENLIELRKFIELAGEIGATDIVIHPIPSPGVVSDYKVGETARLIGDAVSRSLDDLVPSAERAGVRMNLENLPYKCDFPYLTMEQLRPLVDGYPEDQVGLIIDTGHVGIHKMDPAAEIRTAGSRLHGTHLHDVDFSRPDGDHRAPTHGGLDWDAILRALIDIDYQGPRTFEVAVPCHGESYEELAHITRQVANSWAI